MFSLFRTKKNTKQAAPPPAQLTLLPGSQGEHQLQKQYGTRDRALKFYDRQVLNYLSQVMSEFISRQEVLFIATSDKHGECDCSARFGLPGFVKVLNEQYLVYPEYRGNGVMASLGNIVENPHIGMIFVDFFDSTVGLHVNGKARICEHENLLDFVDELPQEVINAINSEGKRRPERWIMVEIEEAYLHCSKHIPLLKKMDKSIDWGTDNAAVKRSDYFKLDDIPLYNRIGGDIAMNILVDRFYRKILADKALSGLFDNLDMPTQLKKQKQFLKMAFGGCPLDDFAGKSLREIYRELINNNLNDDQFDGIMRYFKATMKELDVPENEIQTIIEMFDTPQHEITTGDLKMT